jgi:hypothetical protein
MNRAWIPAGALAGVSVAGLLALGPLTDSLGTKVAFPPPVEPPPVAAQPSVVPVSVDFGKKGTLKTEKVASLHGGQAIALPDTNPDAGQVGFRRSTGSSSSSTSSTGSSSSGGTSTTQAPPAKPKTPPKRQTTITATGESNGDAGLAGGSSGSSGLGEQSGTPGG